MKSPDGMLDQILAIQFGDERRTIRIIPCHPSVFHKGQILQVWSKLAGIYRGNAMIERVTAGYLVVDNIPIGTQPGDLLIFSSEESRGNLTPEKTGTNSD